jgi:hypothetical protein
MVGETHCQSFGLITSAYHHVVDVSQTHRNHRREERGGVQRSCVTLCKLQPCIIV